MSHLFHTAVSLRGQSWLSPNKWSTVLAFLRYHIPFGTR